MAETRGVTRRDLFRMAAASGVTTAVGLHLGEGGPRAAAAATPPPTTPQAALQALKDGNARFVAGLPTSFDEDETLVKTDRTEIHDPWAALLSCADARVSPEILFDQPMGDLFVARVAGNITTPEIIASLEFACAAHLTQPPVGLRVRLIVVLGHRRCGAVSAAATVPEVPGQISALYAPIRPAVQLGGPTVEDKTRANAVIQAVILRDSSPVISLLVKLGTVEVHAAYYDILSKQVTFLTLPPPAAPPVP